MTQAEFKAWFDGFTEAIEKAPTQKQWARIKERVTEIDGKAVTERVYVDRYWQYNPYRPISPYWSYPVTYAGNATTSCLQQNYEQAMQGASVQNQMAVSNQAFSSVDALYALGKAEAQGQA